MTVVDWIIGILLLIIINALFTYGACDILNDVMTEKSSGFLKKLCIGRKMLIFILSIPPINILVVIGIFGSAFVMGMIYGIKGFIKDYGTFFSGLK